MARCASASTCERQQGCSKGRVTEGLVAGKQAQCRRCWKTRVKQVPWEQQLVAQSLCQKGGRAPLPPHCASCPQHTSATYDCRNILLHASHLVLGEGEVRVQPVQGIQNVLDELRARVWGAAQGGKQAGGHSGRRGPLAWPLLHLALACH